MKSFRTIISAGFLASALALAGCGGGGSENTTPTDTMPTQTDEEKCLAGDGVVYEGDVCKTAEDLRNEGRDAAKEAEDAKAMEAMAKKLRGLLAVAAVDATNVAPTNTATASTHLEDALTAAGKDVNGEDGGSEEQAHVMMYNNEGPMVKVDTLPTGEVLTTISSLNSRFISGSGFATGTSELKEHDDGSTVRGHYRGASGGYVCTSDCTSQLLANGGIMLGGTWSMFDVDAAQMYTVVDASYAEWGWWIDEGIADADPANDKVGAWYRVVGPIDADAVTAASGKATYNGAAVGKVAFHHSLGEDDNIGGAFTADAELNADFDDNMLSGSITGFDIGGVKPGWSVELMEHAIAETGVAYNATAADRTSQTKWTINRVAGDPGGSWSAQFYDVPEDEHQPSGVAGGFQAQYESDGYMVGAFGAER